MSTLRAALEEALAANPDDLATHMAYADLLVEQGDPRGEFVQVQLALEAPSCQGQRKQELQYRQLMLLAHEREWLGELAKHLVGYSPNDQTPRDSWGWSRGWLDEVYFASLTEWAAMALAQAPAARLLRRLGVDEGDLAPLRDAPFLGHLRYFRFGEEVDFEADYYGSPTYAHGLAVPLVALMPRLEELYLLTQGLDLKGLFGLPTLNHLKTLVVYHERSDVYPLDLLAENPAFSSLERLRLHPGFSGDRDGYLPLEEVATLFHSPHLGHLKHLHLHASSMGDEGIEELVESGLLERLETLDLRFGRVTDAGVNTLLDSPHVHHLEYLSLDDNQLSDEGVALLRDLDLPVVRCDNQHEEGDEDYLYSGDME
ncbi:MAG: TIGR02996 domain-containing protein [Gemmataceae bacterium]